MGAIKTINAASGTAKRLDLSELFREALKHGAPRISTFNDGTFSARISRNLGNSEIATGFEAYSTPERAMLAAIEEALLWGLPDLEVKI